MTPPARVAARALAALLALLSAMPVLVSAPAAAAERASGPSLAAAEPPALWEAPLHPLEVTGPYRAPPHRYGSGHRGIDLAASPGTSVVAPAAGLVSFAGVVVDRPVVSVRVDERTVYSLEPVASGLAKGDRVAAGAVLGEAAAGGHCAQECVHLGVRVAGEYVNPLRYLVDRPVLLPW